MTGKEGNRASQGTKILMPLSFPDGNQQSRFLHPRRSFILPLRASSATESPPRPPSANHLFIHRQTRQPIKIVVQPPPAPTRPLGVDVGTRWLVRR